jgi:hypothetical protein
MADLVTCGRRVPQVPLAQLQEGPTVADVTPHLQALELILKAGRASDTKVKDLGLLIGLLHGGNGSEIDSRYLLPMLNALRQILLPKKPETEIREFINRLKAEIGSDRFDQVLSELANSGLKKEHLIEVARGVYGSIPKSTSRKAALGYIRRPHDAFMSAKRGIDATGGRSAA